MHVRASCSYPRPFAIDALLFSEGEVHRKTDMDIVADNSSLDCLPRRTPSHPMLESLGANLTCPDRLARTSDIKGSKPRGGDLLCHAEACSVSLEEAIDGIRWCASCFSAECFVLVSLGVARTCGICCASYFSSSCEDAVPYKALVAPPWRRVSTFAAVSDCATRDGEARRRCLLAWVSCRAYDHHTGGDTDRVYVGYEMYGEVPLARLLHETSTA